MIDLKFQSGALFGTMLGIIVYKYFNLGMENIWIFVVPLFVVSFILWAYASYKKNSLERKERKGGYAIRDINIPGHYKVVGKKRVWVKPHKKRVRLWVPDELKSTEKSTEASGVKK